jgi:hypothetical protein
MGNLNNSLLKKTLLQRKHLVYQASLVNSTHLWYQLNTKSSEIEGTEHEFILGGKHFLLQEKDI